MVKSKFERPHDLPSEATICEIEGYRNVVSVENLPKNLREKCPNGLVMKQIDEDPLRLAGVLGGDYRAALNVVGVIDQLEVKLGHKPSTDEITHEFTIK